MKPTTIERPMPKRMEVWHDAKDVRNKPFTVRHSGFQMAAMMLELRPSRGLFVEDRPGNERDPHPEWYIG